MNVEKDKRGDERKLMEQHFTSDESSLKYTSTLLSLSISIEF